MQDCCSIVTKDVVGVTYKGKESLIAYCMNFVNFDGNPRYYMLLSHIEVSELKIRHAQVSDRCLMFDYPFLLTHLKRVLLKQKKHIFFLQLGKF